MTKVKRQFSILRFRFSQSAEKRRSRAARHQKRDSETYKVFRFQDFLRKAFPRCNPETENSLPFALRLFYD
jgi:hypothetical protein